MEVVSFGLHWLTPPAKKKEKSFQSFHQRCLRLPEGRRFHFKFLIFSF